MPELVNKPDDANPTDKDDILGSHEPPGALKDCLHQENCGEEYDEKVQKIPSDFEVSFTLPIYSEYTLYPKEDAKDTVRVKPGFVFVFVPVCAVGSIIRLQSDDEVVEE
jgi:hypothetical protein